MPCRAATVLDLPAPINSTTPAKFTPQPGGDNNVVSESDEEDGVCVDVRLLNDISDRVFKKDRLARVVCDVMDNCAARGHMVEYEGRAMRMGRYCEIVGGCVEKVMYVNSPRRRNGLRVQGNGGKLLFTAFAARFNTRFEEVVLNAALRAGF